MSTIVEPSPRSPSQKVGEVFFPTPVLRLLSDPCEHLPQTHLVFFGFFRYVLRFASLYLQVVRLSVLLESFQEFVCRDEFIPVALLRSQLIICKDMMKEAWLLCFDEFQVTHISS